MKSLLILIWLLFGQAQAETNIVERSHSVYPTQVTYLGYDVMVVTSNKTVLSRRLIHWEYHSTTNHCRMFTNAITKDALYFPNE